MMLLPQIPFSIFLWYVVDFPLTTRASCILPCQKHIIIWYNKGYPNIGVSDRSHEPSQSLYQQKEKESLIWKIGKFKDKILFHVVDFPLTTLYIIVNLVPRYIGLCVSVALNSNAVKSMYTIWVNASMATILSFTNLQISLASRSYSFPCVFITLQDQIE